MTDKNLPQMSLIGDHLRECREQKKMSLDKVAQLTKINLNVLKHLEKNDFAQLPSAAYVKGFVLSYARALGLKSQDVILKLEYSYLTKMGKPFPALNHTRSPHSVINEAKKTVEESPTDERSPQEVLEDTQQHDNKKKMTTIGLASLGALILIIALFKVISKTIEDESNSNKVTEEKTFVPSSEIAPKKPDPLPAAKTEITTEKVPEVKPTPAQVTAPEVIPPTPVVKRLFPFVEFRKIKTRLFNVVNTPNDNEDNKLTVPDNIRSAMEPEMENVYIKATEGNTWLSYKLDEKPITSVIIEKNKDLFLKGKEILIFLGNVNVTKIFYNNQLIETPTKTGVKSLVFPEVNADKYVLPLFPKSSDDVLYTSDEYQKRMKKEEEEIGVAKKPE